MPSLNVDLDYFGHRKTTRLVARLGEGAEVIPLRLWAYVGKYHCEDGLLAGYTDAEIVQLIGLPEKWAGNAVGVLETLVELRWLLRAEGGYRVHGWLEHQSHIAAFKIRGKLGAAAKWEKFRGLSASSIPQAKPDEVSGIALTELTELTSRESNARADADAKRWEECVAMAKSLDSVYLPAWAANRRPWGAERLEAEAKALELMVVQDGRSAAPGGDIHQMLDWIHEFKSPKGFTWRAVIRSATVLRKKWNEGLLDGFTEAKR